MRTYVSVQYIWIWMANCSNTLDCRLQTSSNSILIISNSNFDFQSQIYKYVLSGTAFGSECQIMQYFWLQTSTSNLIFFITLVQFLLQFWYSKSHFYLLLEFLIHNLILYLRAKPCSFIWTPCNLVP